MKESINKELIFNYFSGNATAFEKELIDQWSADAHSKELLFIWLLEWENQNLQYDADVEKGIERHFSRMDEFTQDISSDESDRTVLHRAMPLSGKLRHWLAAAAVSLVMLSGGWLVRNHIRYEVYATDFGQIQRIQLADGSKVILNANSTLKVPRFGFGKTTRDVYMTGEADFAITHTKDDKKFIVHTSKNFNVEVLGTEFNVYARSRGSRVVLNAGKVKLHYTDGASAKQIVMKPGELVTMNQKGQPVITKTDSPQNFSAWKAHRFVFENESLRSICDLFEDNFGLKVLIPDSTLAAQTISGSFTALNAEELVETLVEDSGLSYQKSEDGKIITLNY
ncbi:FecR family protein [Dyadobacter sp. MSC1_007]|jgi:transmembrane sensor|uniref:FecR family protein n=1 Tax=Dyadobacter sp. MSC1_007 TaxID=2909264 RepID=UPI00202DE111|nr:FecR domain-containing protein [Dyadobacter sp. MSC1_007]